MIAQRRHPLTAYPSRELGEALAVYAQARARHAAPGWAVRGFVAGVALVALAVGLEALLVWRAILPRPVLPDRLWLLALPVLAAAAAAIVVAARRAPAEELAREADTRLELAQRVATALELERQARRTERGDAHALLAALQRADALRQLQRFDPAEVYPIRLTRREAAALGIALAALVAIAALPDVIGVGGRRPVAADEARAQAERLSALADELASADDVPSDEKQLLGQALAQTAEQLQREADAPERALAALSEAERSLARQENPGAADSELALARAADALSQAEAGRELAGRLDRRDYAGAAEELRRLGRDAGQLSPEQQRDLADALQKAAAGASRLDPALSEKLRDAAEALGGDRSEAAAAQAGDEIQRAGEQVQRQDALERALAALQESRQAISQAERTGSGQAQGQGQQAGASGAGREQGGASAGQGAPEQGSGDPGSGAAGGQEGAGSGDRGDAQGNQPGGSGAGTGSVRARGESPRGDFRSRQVSVPSGDFDRPEVSAGQQSGEAPIGEATVDYRQVLPQYSERATEAMSQRYVPPALKDLVRDYFSSLGGQGARR